MTDHPHRSPGGTSCYATPAEPPTAVTTITAGAQDDPAQSSAPASSTAPVSKAVITSTPADAATGASVLDPVVVKAANGTLDTVTVTNPEGREVAGAVSPDGTSWTSAEPLGYGRNTPLPPLPGIPSG